MLYGSLFAYNISLTLTKVSILLQYQRFLHTPIMKNFRLGVLVLVILYGCTTVVTTLVICLPVGGLWDLSGTPRCLDREALWLAHAILNIVSDLVIIVLPIPFLLNLSLPRKQKYGLTSIFAVGILYDTSLLSVYQISLIEEGFA